MMTLAALISQYWREVEAYESAFRDRSNTMPKLRKLADQTYERTLRRMARTPIRSVTDALAAVDWLGRFEYATVRTHEAVVASLKRYVAGELRVNGQPEAPYVRRSERFAPSHSVTEVT